MIKAKAKDDIHQLNILQNIISQKPGEISLAIKGKNQCTRPLTGCTSGAWRIALPGPTTDVDNGPDLTPDLFRRACSLGTLRHL